MRSIYNPVDMTFSNITRYGLTIYLQKLSIYLTLEIIMKISEGKNFTFYLLDNFGA